MALKVFKVASILLSISEQLELDQQAKCTAVNCQSNTAAYLLMAQRLRHAAKKANQHLLAKSPAIRVLLFVNNMTIPVAPSLITSTWFAVSP